MRSGFVSLVGRPNVGKSTLVNALCGVKVSIVSDKPQTTRTRIRGVVTRDEYQIIFVDTPGLHKAVSALGERVNATALESTKDVDVVCLVIDATQPFGSGDQWVASHIDMSKAIVILNKIDRASPQQILSIAGQIRTRHKQDFYDLIDLYSNMDAYQSLARVFVAEDLCFPNFTTAATAYIEATGCYHPLLETPTPYNISLEKDSNFLFLTGANMAGKSTFIKAVGISVYLAHLGMGVPAKTMELTLFDGLLSNINVMDNIIKGESYFYNEVKRIKNTIEKINDGKNWLILIDELFKGTNVEDAMKCSTAVIEGLRKIKPSLFILSTHLYEIGANLKQYANIQFKYFETNVDDGELVFNYQLKEGISDDRLGYLILKREGVVDLLQNL